MTDNAFRIDGLVVNDYANSGPGSSLHMNMGVDAIREFSVLTNNYSAEYQSAAGAIVSAVTKSGTNKLHGSGFWTLRNDNLDAAKWEDSARGSGVKGEFKQNQFGGSLGGPVLQDKTFVPEDVAVQDHAGALRAGEREEVAGEARVRGVPQLKGAPVMATDLATGAQRVIAMAPNTQHLSPAHPVKVSRIGFGLPSGGGVLYADSVTLKSALDARRQYD